MQLLGLLVFIILKIFLILRLLVYLQISNQ